MSKKHLLMRKVVSGLSLSAMIFYPAISFGASLPPTDAGQVLRDSQQNERSLPLRQSVNIEANQEVKPPMNNQQSFKTLVRTYHVTGQDVFSQDQLLPLLAPFTNQELTFTDLQQAADCVTKYFRSQGYLMTQAYIPAQEINNADVEISVLVGRYGDIIVKNNSTLVDDNAIKSQITALRTGDYITSASLERAVLLAGDLMGVKAKVSLARGKMVGTSDVVIEAVDRGHRVNSSLSSNNWGNRFTGSNQVNADVLVASPAHRGDSLNISATSTGSGLKTGGVTYRMPVRDGSNITVSYSKVHYQLGEEFANADAYGTAHTSHVDWSYALRRSRNNNLGFQLGYDHKRMEDNFAGINTGKSSNAVSLTLAGDSVDDWGGGGANSYNLGWRQGNISGQSNGNSLSGNWQKTSYSLNRQQQINSRLSLQLLLSGQFANTNLDSSEKFSLGGANAVRAYPSGEGSGDEGWLFTSELRWTLPVKNSNGILQAAAFLDAGGSTLEKNPTVKGLNERRLAACGLGLLWTTPGDYNVKTYYAWKAGHEVASSDTDKNGRLWLQVSKSL